jgi:hypothetical protein
MAVTWPFKNSFFRVVHAINSARRYDSDMGNFFNEDWYWNLSWKRDLTSTELEQLLRILNQIIKDIQLKKNIIMVSRRCKQERSGFYFVRSCSNLIDISLIRVCLLLLLPYYGKEKFLQK